MNQTDPNHPLGCTPSGSIYKRKLDQLKLMYLD